MFAQCLGKGFSKTKGIVPLEPEPEPEPEPVYHVDVCPRARITSPQEGTDNDTQKSFQCAICLCENTATDLRTTTTCGHTFCTACLNTWRKKSLTCPTCRASIDPIVFPSISLSDDELRQIVVGIDDYVSNGCKHYTAIIVQGQEVKFHITRGTVGLLYDSNKSLYHVTFVVHGKQHVMEIDSSKSVMYYMHLKATIDNVKTLEAQYTNH